MSRWDCRGWPGAVLVWGALIGFGSAVASAAYGEVRVIHTFPEPARILAPGAALQATFSSPVDAATIGTETFRLSPPAEGDVTYDAPSRTAVFRPFGPLVAGTVYTATLKTGIQDTLGNTLSQAFSWSFQGGDQPDTSPPYVVTAVPGDQSAPAPSNTAIQIVFSEDLDPLTVTRENVHLDHGTPGEVRYHPPTRTVTVRPDQDLEAFRLYTVELTPGLRDTSGNGQAAPVSWQFQVGAERDTVPPSVVRVWPPDGSKWSLVVGPVSVSARFSEAVDVMTIGGESFFLAPGQPVEVGWSSETWTATMLASVPDDALIQATLTTAIRDLAGNPMPQEVVWAFSVSASEFDICADTPDFPGCESGGGGGCFIRALRGWPAGER